MNKGGVDDHSSVFGRFGEDAEGRKRGTEDGNQGRCDMVTESCTDGECTLVGHPVSYQSVIIAIWEGSWAFATYLALRERRP